MDQSAMAKEHDHLEQQWLLGTHPRILWQWEGGAVPRKGSALDPGGPLGTARGFPSGWWGAQLPLPPPVSPAVEARILKELRAASLPPPRDGG